jgi:hypothetical protein
MCPVDTFVYPGLRPGLLQVVPSGLDSAGEGGRFEGFPVNLTVRARLCILSRTNIRL